MNWTSGFHLTNFRALEYHYNTLFMKNTLPPPLTSTLPLDDKQISFLAGEIKKHAHAVKLRVAFLGLSSELDNFDKTRAPSSFSECWFCHSLPHLFRLNLDAFCDLFVVFKPMEHSSLENLKRLLSQRKGYEAHIIEIDSPSSEPDLFYKLLHNLTEDIPRKICIESYLNQSFSSKEIRRDRSPINEPGLTYQDHRGNIRQALWDKFSQSPELFLKEEIKNIRL